MVVKAWLASSIPVAIMAAAINGCAAPQPIRVLNANDPVLNQLSWLAGSWVTDMQVQDHSVNEVHWTQPDGGSMIGMNRTITSAKTVFFEYLRIESTPTGVVYLASPKGRQPPTPFKMVENSATPPRTVFENPQHDYPKRIIYWRDGNILHGRIEGEQDGKLMSDEWTWHRARIE